MNIHEIFMNNEYLLFIKLNNKIFKYFFEVKLTENEPF